VKDENIKAALEKKYIKVDVERVVEQNARK
jgi:hypothetical protein